MFEVHFQCLKYQIVQISQKNIKNNTLNENCLDMNFILLKMCSVVCVGLFVVVVVHDSLFLVFVTAIVLVVIGVHDSFSYRLYY